VTTNKLTFDPPTRLPELTQNLIRSSHGHSTPSLKISCKSVQPFSRNVADKERKKERKKEIARKQYPVPLYRGLGNKKTKYHKNWHTQQYVGSKVIVKDPTTLQTRCCTTL